MTHAKRPFSCSSTAAAAHGPSSAGVAGTPPSSSSSSLSPPMKKVKPQPPPSSSAEKNGLHIDPAAAAAAAAAVARPAEEEEAMLVDAEAEPAAAATTGVAANLFRKKATPPQPSAKKQLRIKITKGQPKLPTNFEDDTWAKLKAAISAIFLKQPLSCDTEKLYQAVGDLCLYKMGANLYERMQKECEGTYQQNYHHWLDKVLIWWSFCLWLRNLGKIFVTRC
uniref:Cullin N-terminal domain-containing protein n=1 Tax=Ananas comosus var. bracteatus TaxID=296719 RepID=A0A6V7NM18_ANACO|nr:unnamed protein product [Ananas comosus var. bracteatus]